jgi:hypothetical protein
MLGIQENSSVPVLVGKAERGLERDLQQCISSQFLVLKFAARLVSTEIYNKENPGTHKHHLQADSFVFLGHAHKSGVMEEVTTECNKKLYRISYPCVNKNHATCPPQF